MRSTMLGATVAGRPVTVRSSADGDRASVHGGGRAVVLAARPPASTDLSLLHLRGVPWARIGEHVGQRNLAVTANTYTHVLVDEERDRLRGVDGAMKLPYEQRAAIRSRKSAWLVRCSQRRESPDRSRPDRRVRAPTIGRCAR